jgi:hypothetical protein
MISATALSLWMSVDVAERASALADLLRSGDLAIHQDDGDAFGVTRSHSREITIYEIGTTPILPTAVA